MVYVDNINRKYRGMIMNHMIADSHSELMDMAEKLDLNPKWIQHEGTKKEHFDICKQYKVHALKNGAKEVHFKELSKMIQERDYQLYDY